MPLILAVRNSSGLPQVAPLRIERGEVVIGRGTGVGLALPSQSVSRRHCTVSGEGANWRVVDSSSGGTFVNAQRIAAPHFLRHGDVVRVGEIEIAVMIEQAAAGTAPAAPAAVPDSWGRPAPAPVGGTPGPAGGQDAIGALLQAAGVARGQIAASDQQVAAVAGAVLRAALASLSRLAQDRHRARVDLGVDAAGAAGGGAGGAGSPEELLLRLLALPAPQATQQVDALGAEIDAHQRAVLGAMQGTLHQALDQFSPTAIKTVARGDADAWKAYERAFEAKDGFVEVFAQTLSRHYAEAVKA